MPRKRVLYLTMEAVDESIADFHLTFEPMRRLGWDVDVVPWQKAGGWESYDAVYPCAAWDYPLYFDEFTALLAAVEASPAIMLNDLGTIRWNIEKTYLRDVDERGARIVPSRWYSQFDAADVRQCFAELDVEKIVVKPVIGANARDTYVLENPADGAIVNQMRSSFARRSFVVQPFIDSIETEGEYSLFFFGGDYSHAVLKTPDAGDFRVQEEYGASISAVEPDTDLRRIAEAVFSTIEPQPVYGRGDWVRGPDGRYLLMELELIEPSLYLGADSGAAARFARAFDQRFQELTGK